MDTITQTQTSPEQKPRSLLALLLINRNYALLWVAMTTSQIGNFIFNTSLVLWVATTLARNAPWAPLAVGALAFLPQIVGLASGTVAGVFVDRWDKRRTMLWMDGLRSILVFLLVPFTGIIPLPFPAGSEAAALFQLTCLLIVVGLLNTCSPFVNGALFAILYDIVDEADMPRAFGRGQVLNNLATLIGPISAAAIFFTFGIQWAIILNAISFIISFLATYLIRPASAKTTAETSTASTENSSDAEAVEKKKKAGFWHELVEGLQFVASNNVLVSMAILFLLSTLGLGAISILGVFFATNNLHSSPQLYPFLNVSFGIGAMLGAITGAWVQKKLGLLHSFWLLTIATGALLLVFSRLTNLWVACVVLGLVGLADSIVFIAQGPLMMKVTPRELLGRANGVLGQIATLTTLISIVVAAFLIATPLRNRHIGISGLDFGPVDIIFTAAGILVIISGLCSMVALRNYKEEGQEIIAPPRLESRRSKQAVIGGVGILLAVLCIVSVASAAPSYQANSTPKLAQSTPANGQPIGNLRCETTVGSQTHIATHLSLYVDNQALAIPAGIGIVAPPQPGVVAQASNGKTSCLYPLHVYEHDNIIHTELHNVQICNLGQFFAIWGQPLSRTQVLGYQINSAQSLEFRVFDAQGNQHIYTGDPRAIPLQEHETIIILINSPQVTPTAFTDWNGV